MTIYGLFLRLAGAGFLLLLVVGTFEGQRGRGELSGVSGQGIGCLCWDDDLFCSGSVLVFCDFSYPKGASVANRSFAAGASVFDMTLFSYSKTSPAVDGFPPSGALVTISPHLRLCAG